MAGGRYPSRTRHLVDKAVSEGDQEEYSLETENMAEEGMDPTSGEESQETLPAIDDEAEAESDVETVDLDELDEEGDEEEDFVPRARSSSRGRSTSRLTARQRAKLEGSSEAVDHLLSLPPAPSRRSNLTNEEQQLRRAEAAKRRKLLSDKKKKEEQHQTIQKILGGLSASKRRETEAAQKMEEKESQRTIGGPLGAGMIRSHVMPECSTVAWSEDLEFPRSLQQPARSPPQSKEEFVLEGLEESVRMNLGQVLLVKTQGKDVVWTNSEGDALCRVPSDGRNVRSNKGYVVRSVKRRPSSDALVSVLVRPL